MPVLGTITPIEFAEEEWTLLKRAWSGLNPDAKQRKVREKLEQLRAEGKLRPFPALPAWQDIVKLGPLRATTPEEERARKIRAAIRIRNSPTPQEVRAFGAVVNALDDAQDLAAFISLVGRLIVRFAPRALVRLIPGIGVITTAADVLNYMTWLTQALAVGAGFQFGGLSGAAAAAAGPAVFKAALKTELWESLRLGTRKRIPAQSIRHALERSRLTRNLEVVTRGGRKVAIPKVRIGIPELLTAVQATDTLWGVGISLGAIMGWLQDIAFGLQRAAFGPGALTPEQAKQHAPIEVPVEYVLLPLRARTDKRP